MGNLPKRISTTVFTIIYAVLFLITFIATLIPFAFLVIVGIIFGKATREKVLRSLAKVWGRFVVYLSGSTVIVHGRENIVRDAGNIVYIINHQSFFDIPLVMGFVDERAKFIARESLLRVPLLGLWMRQLGTFFVGRRPSREELRRFNIVAEELMKGGRVAIFPEGTRSTDGTIGKFHPSALRPARVARSTIIPVRIFGSRNILPRGAIKISPSRVRIVIGKPIAYENYSDMRPAELANFLREVFENELTLEGK